MRRRRERAVGVNVASQSLLARVCGPAALLVAQRGTLMSGTCSSWRRDGRRLGATVSVRALAAACRVGSLRRLSAGFATSELAAIATGHRDARSGPA